MPVNDTTTNLGYQKPNIANTLADDVGRLRSALDSIDTDMVSKAPTAGPTFTGVTTVAAGSAGAPSLTFTGATSDTGIYSPGADQVAISTGGTGRLFVDASGRTLVNQSTNVGSAFLQVSSEGSPLTASFIKYVNAANGAELYLRKSRGTFALPTTALNNDIAGSVVFNAYNGSGYGETGAVISVLEGAPSATSTPGRLLFSTTPSGSTITSERMRITSDGRLLVGTSSDSGGALLQINGDRFRVGTAKTPASATATGTTGEICWDASYVYVCIATDTWKRAALSTW